MSSLWLPLRWFIDVFNLVIDFEPISGLSLGTISLGFLTIILIFRMIIFPLTGGSISSAIQGAYDNSAFKKNRDAEKAYQRYKQARYDRNQYESRFNREHGIVKGRSDKK